MDRRRSGTMGEIVAACFLALKGYDILARNYRRRGREIDIVAAAGARVVFVEVKLRRGASKGLPREAVDARKRAHIVSAARSFLAETGRVESSVRFDVIEVTLEGGGLELRARHIPGAFAADR